MSTSAAAADMTAIAASLKQEFPDTNGNIGAVVVPKADLGNTQLELLVLMAPPRRHYDRLRQPRQPPVVARRRTRRARRARGSGATRGRLVRQMVIEGVRCRSRAAFWGGGATAGVFAGGATRSDGLHEVRRPRSTGAFWVSPSGLGGNGLLFSIVPALQSARASLRDAQQNMRSAVGGSSRASRDALVVLQSRPRSCPASPQV